MPLRWGPGPVFVHESIAATRRWQLYALRSLFVLSLLVALAIVWLFVCLEEGHARRLDLDQAPCRGGQYFFYAIATTQLMVVLLVAPAATAGAICLDRARGNLTHMLVTDLADAEIVLGKLAARLLPVVALVAATIPVLALAGPARRGHLRGDPVADADHAGAGGLRLHAWRWPSRFGRPRPTRS